MTKNIISFSLYGTKSMYWRGALANIELAKIIYPDYICRFYIDQDAPSELKNSIIGDNIEKVFMKNKGGFNGSFWRFLPATEKDVNIFLCRDADSRLSLREKSAVDEWLISDKDFHVMRDHPHHKTPILGGMWGCRNQILCDKGIEQKILNWSNFSKFGDDQKFLTKEIYPIVKNSALEHSEYNIKHFNTIYPFPINKKNDEFVGKKYNEYLY